MMYRMHGVVRDSAQFLRRAGPISSIPEALLGSISHST